MKIAFISDIHSNIHAFTNVLNNIKNLDVDEIWNCGDIVGYNAFPKDCLDLIRDEKINTVLGNHDLAVADFKTSWFKDNAIKAIEFSRENLLADDIDFLKNLAYKKYFERDGFSFYITHGSPRDNLFEYVYPSVSEKTLKLMANKVKSDIIVLGHTHIQMEVEINHQLFLNPGSVGQPRDGISKACFMVFDTEIGKADWFRVKYDIVNAAKAIIDNDLPNNFSERLFKGV